MSFLDFLGAALSQGGHTFQNLKERDRVEAERQRDEAFRREQLQLQQTRDQRDAQQQEFDQTRTKFQLTEAGDKIEDPQLMEMFRKHGFGGRFADTSPFMLEQNTVEGTTINPGGHTRIATTDENRSREALNAAINANERTQKFQQFIEGNPNASYDELSRQSLLAGQGAVPLTSDEFNRREAAEHRRRMAEIGAQRQALEPRPATALQIRQKALNDAVEIWKARMSAAQLPSQRPTMDDLNALARELEQQYLQASGLAQPTAPGASGGGAPAAGPQVGEERVIDGIPAVWDGQGWALKEEPFTPPQLPGAGSIGFRGR